MRAEATRWGWGWELVGGCGTFSPGCVEASDTDGVGPATAATVHQTTRTSLSIERARCSSGGSASTGRVAAAREAHGRGGRCACAYSPSQLALELPEPLRRGRSEHVRVSWQHVVQEGSLQRGQHRNQLVAFGRGPCTEIDKLHLTAAPVCGCEVSVSVAALLHHGARVAAPGAGVHV